MGDSYIDTTVCKLIGCQQLREIVTSAVNFYQAAHDVHSQLVPRCASWF